MIGFGQVNIPDAIFKAYLVGNTAINTNGDTEIQVSEANSFVGGIDCSNMNISDLTGIEYFSALTSLQCENNQLTTLDLSQNTVLLYFTCSNNQLTSIDVSNSTALKHLRCDWNQLTSLDISNNPDLTEFDCFNNNITSLDASNNPDIDNFECQFNQLTSLDVRNGNNTNWSSAFHFHCIGNPNLTCISVDDPVFSTNTWNISIDNQHYFSANCSTTAIEEHSTNKELLKVTDLLGRETKETNQPLFYIYDDGTVEKRIVIKQ